MRIVLATHNPGKLAELHRLAGALPLRWASLADYPGVGEAPETGASCAANARQKALHYAACTGAMCLADDSGLEVDALDGAPGAAAAHFAGHPRDDGRNNAHLLARLAGVPPERRTARFRCVLALADGGHIVGTAEGVLEGRILDAPRGANGFGYDPLFFVPAVGSALAELAAEEKNRLSHRARAAAALFAQLAPLLHAGPGCLDPSP